VTEQRAIETSTSDLMQKLLLEVQRFDRMTADEIGINATDLLCLVWVERAEQPVSAKALSGFLGISTGSTTALIDRLEKRKLLKRARHPTDRRGITLQPGPAVARPEIVAVRAQYRNLMTQAWSGFSEAELLVVQRFLLATIAAMGEQIGADTVPSARAQDE
jgi:DNA-binding MarR family transcriptional regulator|tara:strand:+ start:15408 stop:15893 length:486 start_codon:yes stop_codon:yes gene_type:complete